MNVKNISRRVLGAAVWLTALGLAAGSVFTVKARTSRPHQSLVLDVAPHTRLFAGDPVFLATDVGLEQIGEVRRGDPSGEIELAIGLEAFGRLNRSTQAVYWQTPLSAEEAIDALLPPVLQRQAAERIAADWRRHADALEATWFPIAAELLASFLETVRGDMEEALLRHEDELWDIARYHGQSISAAWPAIQRQLLPILQEHLTPVLGRLMNDALVAAPTMNVAASIAMGKHVEAYQQVLDWMAGYLAAMPERDRAEVAKAIQRTWDAARSDAVLQDILSGIRRELLADERLPRVLTQVYREAVSWNPQAAEFVRLQLLQSPRIRRQLYELIELFAPTVRDIVALCLFDDQGGTRPEIVHLVRSIALRRKVAWVTLETRDPYAPALAPGALLRALSGGGKR